MFKQEISVSLVSLNSVKKRSNYAGFACFSFDGGLLNITVDQKNFDALAGLGGRSFVGVFAMRPHSIVLYDRAASVFEPVQLLEIKGQGNDRK